MIQNQIAIYQKCHRHIQFDSKNQSDISYFSLLQCASASLLLLPSYDLSFMELNLGISLNTFSKKSTATLGNFSIPLGVGRSQVRYPSIVFSLNTRSE